VTVKGRVKSFESIHKKIIRYVKENKARPEEDGYPEIPDVIGVRVVCPFLEDIGAAEEIIRDNFSVREVERKGASSFKEFGYESVHIQINIPKEVRENLKIPDEVAEIQIRSILQEAWAEVEHELVYKAEFTPYDNAMRRKLAAVNATLTLADTIFQEIRTYQRQLQAQLGKRRDTFYKKILETNDQEILNLQAEEAKETAALPKSSHSTSIDDLLLNALYAHNRGLFDEAILFYTRILDAKPAPAVKTIIYKHRGMAYFAKSDYDKAVEDFSHSLEADPQSYKAFYYRGIVRSVQRKYDEAIDDFTASLKLYPYQAYTLYRRALARYHLEDYTEALADADSALEIEQTIPEAQKLKTLLLQKLKM
jgi:putative GTP pyrophosphokinase